MLTKDMLGMQFKCRVTPYDYSFSYVDTYGTTREAACKINGIGQVYDEPGRTVLGDRCFIIHPTGMFTEVDSKYLVAFDAICVFTHQAVTVAGHPLESGALPVLLILEVLDAGLAAQDNRLVRVASPTTMPIIGSKNDTDLPGWPNVKARYYTSEMYTSDERDGAKFVGYERYYGVIPEILDSSLAYHGTIADFNTWISTYFLEFSYNVQLEVLAVTDQEVALAADATYLAGVQHIHRLTLYVLSYTTQTLPGSALGNNLGHRDSVTPFAGRTEVSLAPKVSSESNGAIIPGQVLGGSSIPLPSGYYYATEANYVKVFGPSTTGGATQTISLGFYVKFTSTFIQGNDGRMVSWAVAPTIPGNPQVLEFNTRVIAGHAL